MAEDWSMDELRSRRAAARRAAELARLRAQPAEALEAEVRILTDELIARYAADLSLVDSLLGPAYPAGVGGEGRA